MAKTTKVELTLYLNTQNPGPPYCVSDCSGTVYQDNGKTYTFQGWGSRSFGSPKGGGAEFVLKLVDKDFDAANNKSQVDGWVMTFLPRPGVNNGNKSPFEKNQNTISGEAIVSDTGTFALLDPSGNPPSNVKIKDKNPGHWDWVFLVQMTNGSGTHCYATDPEMQVDAVM